MKIDLNQNIEFKIPGSTPSNGVIPKAKLPTKTTINLVMKEERKYSTKKVAIFGAAALVILLLVLKFTVFDQYAKVRQQQALFDETHAKYAAMEEALSHYGEVEAEYRRYAMDWMNDIDSEDYIGVERVKILDMIEKDMMSVGTVSDVSISGQVLTVKMSGMNLEQISKMFSVLDNEPIVAALELNIAQTEENAGSQALEFSVTIALQQPAEGA